ncbi:PAS domain-containing protein [Desertivirga brevis]|uniref:PAS domain-containing protein n=1 Tax=Desertivirga brevis TaxID=2810310 RepID=UPI001A958D4A|nr:PAS domain-containing protein [Pedobacter sp. SYSU D00873]
MNITVKKIFAVFLLGLLVTVTDSLFHFFIYPTGQGSFTSVVLSDLLAIGFLIVTIGLMLRWTSGISVLRSFYPMLFAKHPDPMWIYDLNSLAFLDVNEAAIATYGYSKADFLSMTLKDIRPPAELERFNHAINSLEGEYKKSKTWVHQKKDGQLLYVTITSNEILFKGRHCRLVVVHDITSHKVYEKELQTAYNSEKELRTELEKNMLLVEVTLKEKEQLAEIIRKIQNMVMITDPMANIIWVNDAFTKETGYHLDEIKGKNVNLLHGPETNKDTQEQIMASLAADDNKSFEILNYRKDGSAYWVELRISAIYNSNGEIVEYISIQSVVSERKEKERKIQEQHEALRNLAWLNSHQLRKPVASIISLANIAAELDCNEDCREINSLIKKCAEDLDSSVREMNRQINSTETFNS